MARRSQGSPLLRRPIHDSWRDDDAGRHRVREPERIADGKHPVADLQLIAVAELGHGQIAGPFQHDHGQVAFLIGLHGGSLELPAIGQLHRELAAAVDHVVVREHDSRFINDHARAQAALRVARHLGQVLKNFCKPGISPKGKSFSKPCPVSDVFASASSCAGS